VPATRGATATAIAIATPGAAATVDHDRRRGIVGIGLVDHRWCISTDAEDGQADADVHPGRCGRCCRQRAGGKREIHKSLLHDGSLLGCAQFLP
jgi:hypothetical protein